MTKPLSPPARAPREIVEKVSKSLGLTDVSKKLPGLGVKPPPVTTPPDKARNK